LNRQNQKPALVPDCCPTSQVKACNNDAIECIGVVIQALRQPLPTPVPPVGKRPKKVTLQSGLRWEAGTAFWPGVGSFGRGV
jgi:hypothetical protein